MSRLLDRPPFERRDDAAFLREMNELTLWHLRGSPEYRRLWPDFSAAGSTEELPFLHVGLFKRLLIRTRGDGVEHGRVLTSSATTGASPSRITLDARSSQLQARSSLAILTEMVGPEIRPLLVLDDNRLLRRRDQVSARIAAAMSLRPLASEIHFLAGRADDPGSIQWDRVRSILERHDDLLVYGFTWFLWQAWAVADIPDDIRLTLRDKRVHFVHSGGWKRLESLRVDRQEFETQLLGGVSARSRVIDYYGLVEQVGIVYPLCPEGFRHVPRWADVLIRDAWSLETLVGEPGLLQSMNVLAYGAPYHSVLTEDLGRLVTGSCRCGREGRRFELLGRVPRAEVRGCANV